MKRNISNPIILPRLISDNLVLQREAGLKVWGWGKAGASITLNFMERSYSATAGADGRWLVTLPAFKAGGPYSMELKTGDHVIRIKNILIGDVWVCSGQSNMGLPMSRVKERYAAEIARAENPAIRQLLVPEQYDFNEPREDLPSGAWIAATPESVSSFSAVGYFFAQTLYEKYRVPIGLINASAGGAPAEAFCSEAVLREFPAHWTTAERFKDGEYRRRLQRETQAANERWFSDIRWRDRGLIHGEKAWFDPEYDASAWPTMKLPAFWEDEGLKRLNGVVWFRKVISLPTALAGRAARLWLGRIVDSDTTYVNGIMVGSTGYQYPPRIYEVLENILKAGQNTIVVRVVNSSGAGGFIQDKPYSLSVGGRTIDLRGEWQYRVGAVAPPLADPLMIQWQPLGLFNGMIAPLTNYGIKGVIWYQGEANVGRAAEYRRLFPALITDWRSQWGRGAFPFLYVQLPNYGAADAQPAESEWAELRDAQSGALALPHTGMAVTIDLGEWNDLHPLNKKEVGYRLALAAQKVAHGEKLVHEGPTYRSLEIAGNRITIAFSDTGGGLMIKDGPELKGFAIAGADRKYVWAKAKIEGDRVVVWNDGITAPVALRYAWADNPAGANLYNKEGLPAVPFQAVL